jgi:hypothetical protein
VKVDDELVFLFSEVSSLEIRPKVVHPPQSATLARSKQTFLKLKKKKNLIKPHNISRLCLCLCVKVIHKMNYQRLLEENASSLPHEV